MSQPSPAPDDAVLVDVARTLSELPPARLTEPARWREEAAGTQRPAGFRWPVRARSTTKWTASLAAGALLIGLAIAVSLSGPTTRQAAALPIFSRPAVDAGRIRAATSVLRRNAADYGRARAIDTPSGRGYVMPAGHDSVCLAVPDPGNGYGQSCATQDEITKRGLLVELSVQDGDASQLVALVPSGTTGARLQHRDGSSSDLAITDGVLSASVQGRAELSYRTPAGQVNVQLGAPIRCLDVSPGTSDDALKKIEAQSGLRPCA